jgi:hypothetical protein
LLGNIEAANRIDLMTPDMSLCWEMWFTKLGNIQRLNVGPMLSALLNYIPWDQNTHRQLQRTASSKAVQRGQSRHGPVFESKRNDFVSTGQKIT